MKDALTRVLIACFAFFAMHSAWGQARPGGNGPLPGDPNYSGNGTPQRQMAGPVPDPLALQNELISAYVSTIKSTMADVRASAADPEVQKLREGYWVRDSLKASAPRGEFCSVTYKSLEGALQISGPGGSYKGAMMSLWGLDIPRPKRLRSLKVKLYQNEEPAATITAINRTLAETDLGVLDFQVPTIDGALTAMEDDKLHVRVEMDGATVVDIHSHGNIKAARMLRECVERK